MRVHKARNTLTTVHTERGPLYFQVLGCDVAAANITSQITSPYPTCSMFSTFPSFLVFVSAKNLARCQSMGLDRSGLESAGQIPNTVMQEHKATRLLTDYTHQMTNTNEICTASFVRDITSFEGNIRNKLYSLPSSLESSSTSQTTSKGHLAPNTRHSSNTLSLTIIHPFCAG